MTFLTLLSLLTFWSTPTVVDGYTDRLSVLPGDSVELYFHADQDTTHLVKLYNMKKEVVAEFEMHIFPQTFPEDNAYETGYKYKKTATIKLSNLPSGVYLWENTIPMIIKAKNPKIVVLYPSNTENAYSPSGGKSLYDFNSLGTKKAHTVSFRRPIALSNYSEAFLRWIVEQSYVDVGYITDADLDDYDEIKKSSLLIVCGHSEYWTRQARINFDRFVADGKNALVLSGNTMWWQVRYNESKDKLICFKSAEADDSKSSQLKTTRWNDPTLGYPITKSIGVEFPLAGYGQKTDQGWDGYHILCESPLLEGTDLGVGEILALPTVEYDGAPLLGFNEAGNPVINRQALGFDKIEIVGYDRTTWSGADGVATWIVFKATRKSGIVINTASTDWCSENGIGTSEAIKKITDNMIQKLLTKANVFSPTLGKESMPIVSH